MTTKRTFMHLLLLVATVCAAFFTTLGNGFVWDDTVLLLGREVYRQFDLAAMFLRPGNGVEYLPLRDLSYAVDYALWGERPFGFHLTSLLLYAGNVVAAYYIARALLLRLGKDEASAGVVSLLCALLFAVHPLHSEAVSFITCRNVLISGLFFFLSLLAYLRADQGERLSMGAYAASLGLFVAALLSKATVIILPLLLLLPPFTDHRAMGRRRLLQVGPFFAVAGFFFFAYRAIGKESGIIDASHQGFTSSSFVDRIATAVQIPWFYLGKFLFPLGLSANYDVTFDLSWTSPALWLSVVGLLAAAAAVAASVRRTRLPLLVGGWFIVTLLPVLNFFATVPVVADRYAYLPLFGLCLLVAAGACGGAGVRMRTALSATVGVCIIALGTVTAMRNGVWQSDRTLWEATVKTSPRHIKNRVNLATVYYTAKEYDRALALLEVTKGPNHYYDYYHLFQGHLAVDRGDHAAGAAAFRLALEKDDTFLPALYALAQAHEKLKEYDRAVEYYNRTLLSTELDTNGHRESARAALQRLLVVMNPDIDGWRRQIRDNPRDLIGRMLLAEKLGEFGQYEEALVNFLEMERLGLASWKLFSSIGKTYVKLRDYRNAATYFEKSLTLNPDNGDNLTTLAVMYKKLNRHGDAIPLLQRAIALGDPAGYASFNLALTHYQMGNREASIRSFAEVGRRFPALGQKVGAYLAELGSAPGTAH